METKNSDHHPGNARIRGRQFLTFHAVNVQIWATGHFLSRNTIAIINSAFIRQDLICLFGLTIVQTSSFPRPIVKQLLEFPKPGKFSKNEVLGWLYISMFSVIVSLVRSWTRSQTIFVNHSELVVDRCEE